MRRQTSTEALKNWVSHRGRSGANMKVTDTRGPGDSVLIGDRRVHRIGLGTNRVTDTAANRAFLRRAVELGVDFIDTADVYMSGESEVTIGAVFQGAPSDPLVTTKGGLVRVEGRYEVDGRPAHLRETLELSLRRLRTERLDLYLLHRVDPRVPVEESLGVLREFQDAGRIRQIGVSNVSVSELERARRVARIVCVENRYNIVDREAEDVLRYCEEREIVFIPWFPLLRGKIATSGPLARIAERQGVTPHQVALAWLLQRSPVMLPIPGTLSEVHLKENLAAGAVRLDVEAVHELDRYASAVPS